MALHGRLDFHFKNYVRELNLPRPSHTLHITILTKKKKYLYSAHKIHSCVFVCESEKKAIISLASINLLKPNGYVMHHQFNIQQLYALPTPYLCVLYLSENKQRLVPLTA